MTKTSYQGGGKGKKRYAFWFVRAYTERIIEANIGYANLRNPKEERKD